MPATNDELAELRAEVERLRTEVAVLRAAQPAQQVWPAPGCNCGTSLPGQVHPYPKATILGMPQNYWTGCAGGLGQTYVVNPGAGAEPVTVQWSYNTGCAAPAAPVIFNWPS